jgi:hypothetical protein
MCLPYTDGINNLKYKILIKQLLTHFIKNVHPYFIINGNFFPDENIKNVFFCC